MCPDLWQLKIGIRNDGIVCLFVVVVWPALKSFSQTASRLGFSVHFLFLSPFKDRQQEAECA